MKFLIDVWDEDKFPILQYDFIGYYEFTLKELLDFSATKTPIVLLPPPLKHNQNAGKLYVDVALLGFPMVGWTISDRALIYDQNVELFHC